jgi:hypothetical protein
MNPTYDWANNAIKLNQAIEWVRVNNPNQFNEGMVKARYIEIKGLLNEVKIAKKVTAKTSNKVVQGEDKKVEVKLPETK